MRPDLTSELIALLTARYGFKPASGGGLRHGTCPDCGQKELYVTAKLNAIRCGRLDKCGTSYPVRELFPELFDNWSDRFKATDDNPNAAADAYLSHARRLDLNGLRDAYVQETHYDRDLKIGSATVRFALPGGAWWERLIDQPGRFGKRKANFAPGKSYVGEWWQHTAQTLEQLAAAPEVWIVEGIFDSCSLIEHDVAAVSAMSCVNYPAAALARLAAACGTNRRPKLIWAFDANRAGRDWIVKFHKRASDEGWECGAALTAERLLAKPRDWNDLHIAGTDEEPALTAELLDEYRFYGDLLVAPSASEKARLLALRRGWSAFTVEHGSRTWWALVNEPSVAESVSAMSGDPMTSKLSATEKRAIAIDDALDVSEIAHCVITPLYFQFDEVAGEGKTYCQIEFPGATPKLKALFSAGEIVDGVNFGKRLAGLSNAAVWSGTTHHLLTMRKRPEWLTARKVETVYVTGYVAEHKAWIFPDHAVCAGTVYPLNAEDYFEIGKLSVKPVSTERTLDIHWPGSNSGAGDYSAPWLPAFWAAFGPRGVVALVFFFGSLFAEQIRAKQKSWPFLEIVGEPGGGKTTIIEFLWMLVGRADYEGFDPSKSTPAFRARMMSKVGNLPISLIESDRQGDGENGRGHAKQFDWDELKTAYNGRMVRGRAVANAGMETLEAPMRGTILISQNDHVNASDAIMERIVSLKFMKAVQSPASKRAIDKLHSFAPEGLSAFIIAAVRAEKPVLEHYFAAFETRERGLIANGVSKNVRLVKNHSQLLAALDALAPIVGLDDDQLLATGDFIVEMCRERHVAIAADHPIVQAFWERFDYLESREDPNNGTSLINNSRSPDVDVAVNLIEFEAKLASHKLAMPAPIAELRRHLKTSKYPRYVADKTVNGRFRNSHCWVFQRTPKPGKD